MNKNKTSLLELYETFFKIGLFTFGGGMAMLPIIEKEVIENRKWIDYDTLLDYYSISQTTPGIIMINVATFIGYKERGIIGAIVSTLAAITPSLIIIILIATLINNFSEITWVKSAIKGISAGVCALILSSLIKLGKKNINNYLDIVFALIALAYAYFSEFSIVYLIIIGIVISILIKKKGKEK